MTGQTVRDKIFNRILELEPARPIPYRLFRGFGSNSSTHRAVGQLCEEGHLTRVMTGFYVRPKKLKSLPNITVTCSPEDLAKAWAKERNYILTTTGFEEAYRLRFQTQAPIQTQFWTNGPNKTFEIGNALVFAKHVPDDLLLWHDLPEGRLYRALQEINPKYTRSRDFRKALSILYSSDKKRKCAVLLLLQNRSIQAWHSLLENSICGVS